VRVGPSNSFCVCFGGSSEARGGRAPPWFTIEKDLVRVTSREGQGKLCLRKEMEIDILKDMSS